MSSQNSEKHTCGCSASERSAAEKVVHTEVEVCTDRDKSNDCGCDKTASCREPKASDKSCDCGCTATGDKPLTPAAREMAEELCKNLCMGADSYLHMLPRVQDERIKTSMTGALCFYEKLTGRVKDILTAAGLTPDEGSMMAKMSARAGIAMNTAMDKTDSHIAEMLIEGCTMSITTATKLQNHAEGKEGCSELSKLCAEWAEFEQNHIETLKKFL